MVVTLCRHLSVSCFQNPITLAAAVAYEAGKVGRSDILGQELTKCKPVKCQRSQEDVCDLMTYPPPLLPRHHHHHLHPTSQMMPCNRKKRKEKKKKRKKEKKKKKGGGGGGEETEAFRGIDRKIY